MNFLLMCVVRKTVVEINLLVCNRLCVFGVGLL